MCLELKRLEPALIASNALEVIASVSDARGRGRARAANGQWFVFAYLPAQQFSERREKEEEIVMRLIKSVVVLFLTLAAFNLSAAQQRQTKSVNQPLVVTVLQLQNHGQAVVVQTPGGKSYLVDTGGGGDIETVEKFLKAQGVARLDGILISHPHGDHQGGAPHLLQQFPVGVLFLSPFDRKVPAELKTGESDFSLNLRRLAAERGAKVQEVSGGQTLEWDSALKVEVLWPPPDLFLPPNEKPHGAFNGNSVVLRVQHSPPHAQSSPHAPREGDGMVFLFPGDLTDAAARVLVEQQKEKLKTDVLLVPHHGFFGSQEFAQATQPRVAVASCIVDYKDHPTRNVPGINAVRLFAPLGARVYVTPWQGNVRIDSDGRNLRVTTAHHLPAVVNKGATEMSNGAK